MTTWHSMYATKHIEHCFDMKYQIVITLSFLPVFGGKLEAE